MPLDPTGSFKLSLSGTPISSSKESSPPIVKFKITDLPSERITQLNQVGGEGWAVNGDVLISSSFPQGISGNIAVYDQLLTAGKSDDLGRSHGFFIRVRGRLLNEDDESFGLDPVQFATFNRFRADLSVDDLDTLILSSREEVEDSNQKERLSELLLACFNEARNRYTAYLDTATKKEDSKKEDKRQFVDTRLIERPVADVLNKTRAETIGSEADDSWFYMDQVAPSEIDTLIDRLYSSPRLGFTYRSENLGRNNRMVSFDPAKSLFTLNLDHDFVKAHFDDLASRRVLYDVSTAEALLEVHLREEGVPPHTVGEVLEKRDSLLRGLANDRAFSPKLIAQALRDSAARKYDLEIHLVRAARTLGFVATHVSGSGEPDGIARLTNYPGGEQKITLEAKSSQDVPQLPQLDVAGLKEHVIKHSCQGALVVAPSYPGYTKGGDSSLSARAIQQQISFWTIDELAAVVECVESRHITAEDVMAIVTSSFSPDQVSQAVADLLSAKALPQSTIYRGVLDTLKALTNAVMDRPRTIDMITGAIVMRPGFETVEGSTVKKAVSQMAGASKGGLFLSGDSVTLRISIAELENRISSLLRDGPDNSTEVLSGRSRSGFLNTTP